MSRYQWREARKDFRILLGSKRVQPEPAKAEVSRLLSQVETLASHLRRERAEMRRQMRQSILDATEGQMIKPGPLTRGLPSALLRRKSPWGMDAVAEALHMDDDRLRQQLLSIYGPQSRDDRSEAMRMILESDEYQTAVAKAMRQKLKKARGPLWTRPKPNPSWDMRGECSHPFRLKFDQTPYVGTDGELPRGGDAESIAVRMQMEDAEGEEGMFVAGIGE